MTEPVTAGWCVLLLSQNFPSLSRTRADDALRILPLWREDWRRLALSSCVQGLSQGIKAMEQSLFAVLARILCRPGTYRQPTATTARHNHKRDIEQKIELH